MPSIASIISIIALLLASFLAGVKYCTIVKDQSSWMFESAEELELPSSSNKIESYLEK